MPQVDLISVCAGDPKVSCETTLTTTTTTTTTIVDNDNDNDNNSQTLEQETQRIPCPDYAPESFWLSQDAELDWLDRNAFLDRNDSIKATNNPNPVHFYVGSQRYSVNLKSKASIIALPKSQKQNFAEVKNRRHLRPHSKRHFPKLYEPVEGKPGVGIYEPGSPKVTCMGRVRSTKDRSGKVKNRKKVNEPGLIRVKSVKEKKKGGFWKNVRTIFRSKGSKLNRKEGQQQEEEFVDVAERSSSLKKIRGLNSSHSNISNYNNLGSSSDVSPVETPGLGAINRFASSRKSDAWAGYVENYVMSEPLDHVGPIWRRREVGPPVDIDVGHDWRTIGPVSV